MSTSIRLAQRVIKQVGIPVADIPTFLCPGILRSACLPPVRFGPKNQRPFSSASQRRHTSSITPNSRGPLPKNRLLSLNTLPQQCAGCGALSQTVDREGPGFYTLTRKSVRNFVERITGPKLSAEDEVVKAALENAGSEAANISLGHFPASGKEWTVNN